MDPRIRIESDWATAQSSARALAGEAALIRAPRSKTIDNNHELLKFFLKVGLSRVDPMRTVRFVRKQLVAS